MQCNYKLGSHAYSALAIAAVFMANEPLEMISLNCDERLTMFYFANIILELERKGVDFGKTESLST